MIQYSIAPNGKYAGKLEGTAGEILAQIPAEYDATILPPPRDTDYWNGTNWVAIGSAPAYYFSFNYDEKAWKDNRDLAHTQAEKWESIKLQRNQAEFNGFEFEGHIYDSDYISQGRILAVFTFGQPTEWTLANDQVVSLTAEQVKNLGLALAQHTQSVHARGRAARVLIESATTVAEVDAVIF